MDDEQAIIDEVNRTVQAAGPNPATCGEVVVDTDVQDTVDDDGEEDVWATVGFYVRLPSGKELHLTGHDVPNVDTLNLDGVKSTVQELWQPGVVDALVAKLTGNEQ